MAEPNLPARDAERLGRVVAAGHELLIGRLAVREKLIDENQLQEALAAQEEGGRSIGSILIAKNWIKPADLDWLLHLQESERLARQGQGRIPPEVIPHLSDPRRSAADCVLVEAAGDEWKAWDRRFNRWVAVRKIDPPGDRLKADVAAAVRLRAPHLASIHRMALTDGAAYLVLQYVDGATLERQTLGRRRILEVAAAAARALHAAHEAGVVHGAVNPENLMIDSAGDVWIVNCGLASLKPSGAEFTPPEQKRREPIGPAADVYALGAVLKSQASKMQDPKPELEAIILKATEEEPSRRYASAKEMAEDLDRCLNDQPTLARPASPLRRWIRNLRKPH